MSNHKVFVGLRFCALKLMLHLSRSKNVSAAFCKDRAYPFGVGEYFQLLEKSKARFESILSKGVTEVLLLLLLLFQDLKNCVFYFCYFF